MNDPSFGLRAIFPDLNRERLHPAVYGLVALIMITVGRIQEIITGLWNLHLAKLALVATIVLYFSNASRPDTRFAAVPQVKTLLLFYGLGLISTLFSYWPGKSADFMLTEFLGSVITVLLLVKIVRTWQDLRGVAWGLILTVAVLAGNTLLLADSGGRARLAGTAYDPNDLAAILLVFLPLAYFMMKAERGWKRFALGGVAAASVLTVMATQSRGGFVGLVVVAFAILVRERVRLRNMLLLAVAALFLFSAFAPADYQARVASLLNPSQDYNLTAGGGRLAVWKRGLALMAQHPLLGVGPSVFKVGEARLHADVGGKWSNAHNSFVQVGAEFGVVGLSLFLWLIYSSIRSLRRIRTTAGNEKYLPYANGVELGFYGYIVTGFFLSHGYSSALFLLVGMSSVLMVLANNDGFPSMTAENPR